MRKLLVLIFAVTIIAGCVSNRTFQSERERIGRMEFQQMRNTDELSILRSDYELTAQNLDSLIATLEEELAVLRNDMISLNLGIEEVRTEFTDYAERSDTALIRATDRVTGLERNFSSTTQRLAGIDEQIGQLSSLSTAQREDMARFRAAWEASTSFSEDVLISFDQRLDELQQSLVRSQSMLATMDSRYEQIVEDVSSLESGVQGERSRLEELRTAHASQERETSGAIMSTVERIEALERRLQYEHNTISELISIVTDLEVNISNLQNLVREVSAATLNSVELSITESRQDTSHRLAEMDAKLEGMKASLAAVRSDMGGEISGMRRQVSSVASELTVVANDLEAVTSRTARGAARTDRVITSYNNAKAFYDRGNYEEAIVRLEAFVAANPEHSYVPNALYWIAESYYAGRNMPKALRAFEDVIERFPTHAKARDAKIKVAMCHSRLGENHQAREILNSFVEDYPGYHNMALVQRLLRGLN